MQSIVRHLFVLLLFAPVFGAAQHAENKGWIFLSHKQNLSKKFDLLFDAQLRSTEDLRYINTMLLRPALSYNFNKTSSTAIGYVFKRDWEHEDGGIQPQMEHRLFEQYLFQPKLGTIEVTTRARFEQRFVDKGSGYLFSQRGRAFAAFKLPVFANADFSRGMFLNVQNEIFLNLTNNQNVNGELFDQNRLLGSVGYRWSKALETELGYMWWRQSETEGYSSSRVFQLMVTTQF